MNNKVLVEIDVPILERKFSCFIPVGKTVHQVCVLLAQGLKELSDGAFDKNDVILYNAYGNPITKNTLIKDSEITNGSVLIVI